MALFVTVSVLFMKWQAANQSPEPVAAQTVSSVNLPVTDSAISTTPDLITVDTPLLQVKINPVGGNIVYAVLKDAHSTPKCESVKHQKKTPHVESCSLESFVV